VSETEEWYRLEAGDWVGPYRDCREAVADCLAVDHRHSVDTLLGVLERRLAVSGVEGSEELAVYRETVEAALLWALARVWGVEDLLRGEGL
jgi:hypothetical protein